MAIKTFRNAFGYNDVVLRRKPVRKPGQDLRDIPTYTIPEAAAFLAIPRSTLSRWFRTLLKPSAIYDGDIALLSFRDISEAYILEILRHVYDYSLRDLTRVVANARKQTKLKRPLIEADLRVVLGKVIIQKRAKGKLPERNIDLTQSENPNLFLPEVVNLLGKRLLTDESHEPYRLYPWRLMRSDDSVPVTIDPDIMSGRAVVTGTRIPVSLLIGKKKRGQTAAEIAKSCRLPTEAVEKALQHIERPLQKAA